ncbi:hypothetical protein [Boudabousia marimammalium]|nr:hypothetical protein [Boudabousia marimammalium]
MKLTAFALITVAIILAGLGIAYLLEPADAALARRLSEVLVKRHLDV